MKAASMCIEVVTYTGHHVRAKGVFVRPSARPESSNLALTAPRREEASSTRVTRLIVLEYALAPDAQSYYYSYRETNPYSPEHEGFLAWLTDLNNEPSPPLVGSRNLGSGHSEYGCALAAAGGE